MSTVPSPDYREPFAVGDRIHVVHGIPSVMVGPNGLLEIPVGSKGVVNGFDNEGGPIIDWDDDSSLKIMRSLPEQS